MLTSAFLQTGSGLKKECQKEIEVFFLLAVVIDVISECQIDIQVVHVVSQVTVKVQGK